MARQIRSIQDVVEGQLCTGCGACAAVEANRFEMRDTLDFCRRPFVKEEAVAENGQGLQSCPGYALAHDKDLADADIQSDLTAGWGPVLDVWEGYATDPDVRFKGSSGGAATALSVFAIEKGGLSGVLHTKANDEIAYLNETTISLTKEQLIAASGSRYSPSSPCEGLADLKSLPGPAAFVGKPCDVAALSKARKLDAEIDKKIGISIGFFCAGTPSTNGTLKLLQKSGISDPKNLQSLRFRGNGWPGLWTADYTDQEGLSNTVQMTYAESWGFLQKYRQWRCYICPDHTAEFADISVGDPWYRAVEPGEAGKSLIVARTKAGRDFILKAAAEGYITLETNEAALLPASQPNLLKTRGSLWARLIVLRILGAASPEYSGFKMVRYWWHDLSLRNKMQSFSGTGKRG
ncbi:MAG: Coenzyme F420 hydrogenase/dehydrogenase, beta subunit C-terminal domain, partial [Sneathiella sp.]